MGYKRRKSGRTQQRLLSFIQENVVNRGGPPTYDEMREFLQCSGGTISYHLYQMEKQGILIRAQSSSNSTIELCCSPLETSDRELLQQLKQKGIHISAIIREWSTISI